MRSRIIVAAMVAAVVGMTSACSDYRETAQPETSVTTADQAAVQRIQQTDPSIQRFFNTCYAYAVFPKIVEGAVGIGGAHGDGIVYMGNRQIGYASMSQGTIGAQLGGQSYSEIVFFQNRPALDNFENGEFTFAADASAVAAANGAAASADYSRGVVVFTQPESGLMFQAAIGGQKFSFRPM